jgi:putative ABC transport system substrate-binding protein
MNRRAFLGAVGLFAARMPSIAWAQAAPRVYRMGILGSGPTHGVPQAVTAQRGLEKVLLGRLEELGYAEGRWNSTTALHTALLQELKAAAQILRIRLHTVDVRTPQDLERAFTAVAKERPEALIPLDDPLTFRERQRIADFARRHRLPTASFQRFFTEAGTLFSYGPSFADLFRRAATYVDRILKGASPTDLPVEQPTKFELIFNLKTARALGVKIPRPLLQRADQIIE